MGKREIIFPLDTMGGRIQNERLKKKLSRVMLYKLIKTDKDPDQQDPKSLERTIKNWESGDSCPSVKELERMCKLFGVSSDYLIGGISERTYENHEICEKTQLSEKALIRLEENDFGILPLAISYLLESDEICKALQELISASEVRSNEIRAWIPDSDVERSIMKVKRSDGKETVSENDFQSIYAYVKGEQIRVTVGGYEVRPEDLRRSRFEIIMNEMNKILDQRIKDSNP